MNINSSNIATAEYNRKDRDLTLTFRNRPRWVYIYHKVSPRIWVEFIRAESKGKYLKNIIEPKFFFTKIIN